MTVMGIAVLAVFAGGTFLLLRSGTQEPAIPTVALATVPPDPLLLTRVPLCRQVIARTLMARDLTGEATLYYGTHLKQEFESPSPGIQCARPGMVISV